MSASHVHAAGIPMPYGRSRVRAASGKLPMPVIVAGALLVAAATALVTPGGEHPMEPVFFGLAVGSFVLALNSRAWTLFPLIVTELAITYYLIPQIGVSLRLAGAFGAAVLATPLILSRLRLDEAQVRRVLLPALVFVALATAVNLATSDSDYASKYFRYQVSLLLALAVTVAVVRDRDDVRRVAIMALALGLLSALAAVMQHYAANSALYGAGSAADFHVWKGRSMGLTESPINLANGLLCVLVPVLGVIAAGPWRLDRSRMLYGCAALILAGGVYFTYTRSALLSAGAGLLVVGLLLRGQRRMAIIGVVVSAGILYELLAGTGVIGGRYYEGVNNDRSAASHEALWQVGFAMVQDNPIIGIGHEHFEEESLQYLGMVDDNAAIDRVGGGLAVGREQPHNDFMSVWVSWGIFSLLAYLALFVGALRNFVVGARNGDAFVRGLAVGCAGGLVAYGVNSAFHNSLDSSTFLFLYAGLSVALVKLPISLPARVRRRSLALARRPLDSRGRTMIWG